MFQGAHLLTEESQNSLLALLYSYTQPSRHSSLFLKLNVGTPVKQAAPREASPLGKVSHTNKE